MVTVCGRRYFLAIWSTLLVVLCHQTYLTMATDTLSQQTIHSSVAAKAWRYDVTAEEKCT